MLVKAAIMIILTQSGTFSVERFDSLRECESARTVLIENANEMFSTWFDKARLFRCREID